jgi:hypothetical protein
MKIDYFIRSSAILLITLLCFTRCSDQCKVTTTYTYYEPVYITSAQLKAQVEVQPPHTLKELGRIYFKDGYLFINEKGNGIHVIDNRNPSSPQAISFLHIPGNYDLAIANQTLYADSYVDLVAFDISDITNIKEVNRIGSLFNHYQSMGMQVASEKGILVDWQVNENVTVYKTECDQQQPWGGIYYDRGFALTQSASASFSSKAAIAPSGTTTGVGGSMARFTISGNHLYAMDGGNLDIVEVSSPPRPVAKKEVPIAWDMETIFPRDNHLFFGTQTGMLIYDIQNAESPTLVSRYSHIRSCDPVVVEGDYAYVTLRSGSACAGFTNQLEVIDISNLTTPTLVKTCAMTGPYGLGIDNGTLFVCDGTSGLRVLDARDVTKVCDKQLASYSNIHALDIIPYQGIAMMIGEDGLYQYDYTNPADIKLLSTLALQK